MNDEHQLTPEQWTAVEMCARGCYGGYLSDWPVLQSALRVLCPDVPPAWIDNMGWVKGFCFGYIWKGRRMSSSEGLRYEVESVAFVGPKTPDRGYTIRASWLKPPNQRDALIGIMKDDVMVREFLWPAYKIFNLQAHFAEIVDSEIAGNSVGYQHAGWNGIGPCP